MSLRDPSQWSEKGRQALSRLHVNNVQVKKKRTCYVNYFNEKEHSVSSLYISLPMMCQKGKSVSFDVRLCTSVKAYFWDVQSASHGLSQSLSTPLWGWWQVLLSSRRWLESWNAERLSGVFKVYPSVLQDETQGSKLPESSQLALSPLCLFITRLMHNRY